VFSAGRDGDGGGEGGGDAQQRGEGAIAAARAAGGGGPGLIVSENRLTPLLVYTSIGLSALTPRCAATKRPFFGAVFRRRFLLNTMMIQFAKTGSGYLTWR